MSFSEKINQAVLSVETKMKAFGKSLEAKLKAEGGLLHKYIQEHDQQVIARHEAEKKAQAEAQAEQAQAKDGVEGRISQHTDKDISALATDHVQALVGIHAGQGMPPQADTQAKAQVDPLTQANAINAALQARIAELEKTAEVKATEAALKPATDTTTAVQAKQQLLLAQADGQDFVAEQTVIPTDDALRTASNDSHLASQDALIIEVPPVDTLHM